MERVKKVNTICIPIIRDDLVERCLETLYANTVPNFYVFIIDQTINGIDAEYYRNKFRDLMVIRTPRTETHSMGNLGFAKAFNTGLKLCETEYYTTCNDDIEYVNKNWWRGILDTFDKVDKATPDKPCILVTPSSIKLPDWSIGKPKGEDHYILPYKENYTEEDWNFLVGEDHLVNEHLTIRPGTVIDGVTLYCGIGKTEMLRELGGLSEKYYAGSGEDYSFCCRANIMGYRVVGTTMSWVFHHWSSSLANIGDYDILIDKDLLWNKTNEEWGEGFDIWGLRCPVCGSIMKTGSEKNFVFCEEHPTSIVYIPPTSKIPL